MVMGSLATLVLMASSTVVPAAGLGAKNCWGISTTTEALATMTQLLGSVIVRLWLLALIFPVAPLQFANPNTTTDASAGVDPANTGRLPSGAVLTSCTVSVCSPSKPGVRVKLMFRAGTWSSRRVLSVTANSAATVQGSTPWQWQMVPMPLP